MDQLCIKCKGRGFCGKPCKILRKVKESLEKVENVKENFTGSSPGIFVGHYNYPNVNIGFLAPPDIDQQSWKLDNPEYWYSNKYDINSVLRSRYQMINSKTDWNSHIQDLQLVALSKKPVDIEFNLSKKPKVRFSFDNFIAPLGSNAMLNKMKIIDNPNISKKIEKIVYDDLKAVDQLNLLYKKCDLHQVQKILSSGLLGEDKKIVPTRWSITATDDTISKNLIDDIKEYKMIDNIKVFDNRYLGNHFVVILLPSIWSFEMIEFWGEKKTIVAHDYEFFNGRKNYASNVTGGYYATRLAVAEYLHKIKRQASVIVLRKVSNEYFVPLGVWVVRETARNCFNRSTEFSEKENLFRYIERLIDVDWRNKSNLLNMQKRVIDYD